MRLYISPWIPVSLVGSGGFVLVGFLTAFSAGVSAPRVADLLIGLACVLLGIWFFVVHTVRLVVIVTKEWLWSLDVRGGRIPLSSIRLVKVDRWTGGASMQYVVTVMTDDQSILLKAFGGYFQTIANINVRRLGRWIGLTDNRILTLNDDVL